MVTVKKQLGNDVKDESCNLPAKASRHVMDQIRASNTAAMQRDHVLSVRGIRDGDPEDGIGPALPQSRFPPCVQFRYWYRQGVPVAEQK